MAISVNSIALSLLGGRALSTSATGIADLATYQQLEKSDAARKAAFQKDPQVKREVDYFKQKIGQIKTVDDLFKDRRLYNFVLEATNLSDQAQNFGLVKKALTEKLADPQALANRLQDGRFKAAAQTLQLGEQGLARLQLPSVVDSLVTSYYDNRYESKIEQQSPAVANARYLKKVAGSITDVYQVLADPQVREVVTKAYKIPAQFAIQSVETQAREITNRLNVNDFKRADFVDNLIKRYLVQSK